MFFSLVYFRSNYQAIQICHWLFPADTSFRGSTRLV